MDGEKGNALLGTHQTVDYEFSQLIDVPFAVVVLGRNINYRPTRDIAMVQHPRLARVLCHQIRLPAQLLHAVRLAPLVCLQDGLERRSSANRGMSREIRGRESNCGEFPGQATTLTVIVFIMYNLSVHSTTHKFHVGRPRPFLFHSSHPLIQHPNRAEQ